MKVITSIEKDRTCYGCRTNFKPESGLFSNQSITSSIHITYQSVLMYSFLEHHMEVAFVKSTFQLIKNRRLTKLTQHCATNSLKFVDKYNRSRSVRLQFGKTDRSIDRMQCNVLL